MTRLWLVLLSVLILAPAGSAAAQIPSSIKKNAAAADSAAKADSARAQNRRVEVVKQ